MSTDKTRNSERETRNSKVITSRDNSLLREARAVRDGKLDDLIFVEGLRLCEEALRSHLQIITVIHSDEIVRKDRAAKLVDELGAVCERIASVDEGLLATVSYTKTPQGMILIAKSPESGPEALQSKTGRAELRAELIVILARINNPVNVGAILRSAEAAGATGVIALSNTADPFSPKSLRGAMGSAFRLPIWRGASYAETLAWCANRSIVTVGADLQASKEYTEIDWTVSRALIVGPESTGLTADEVDLAAESVKIPMHGSAESLNVSVAASILLYEAARQRSSHGARV
ncbi:MAG: RNA methyltransferase [bacterium]